MIQKLALYGTLGLLLDRGLAVHWDSATFWCMLGLVWAAEHMGRREGLEQGIVMGIDIHSKMTPEQRSDIEKILKDNE